jgi:hypothetical protein
MIDVKNRQQLLLLIECLVAILEKMMAQAVEAICALFVYVCMSMFFEMMMIFKQVVHLWIILYDLDFNR